MTTAEERQQIEDAWGLVDQLGELSLRLKLAATAAGKCLGLPDQEEAHDQHPRT